jgi:hypothetical protein
MIETVERRYMPKRATVSSQVPLFQFRLRNGVSIGPIVLRRIWTTASGSSEVTVARELRRVGTERTDHVYSLSGPANLFDLPTVETRLKLLLQDALALAYVELKRLV